MRVLVTRPEPEASRTSAAVAALGHEPIKAPLFEVRRIHNKLPGSLDEFRWIFTSANAVRAGRDLELRPKGPVYAVGPHTAEAARTAGFALAGVAGGSTESLLALIRQEEVPDTAFVHLCGRDVAGDLIGALIGAGFRAERCVLYEAVAETTLPAPARAFLETPSGAALFYSPRAARTFANLVRQERLAALATQHTALAISPAVAAEAATLGWRTVRVAGAPAEGALFDLLKAL